MWVCLRLYKKIDEHEKFFQNWLNMFLIGHAMRTAAAAAAAATIFRFFAFFDFLYINMKSLEVRKKFHVMYESFKQLS